MNTPAKVMRCELPAANGIATARSLAKMYAACIGKIDGVQLMNANSWDRVRKPRTKDLPQLPPMAHFPKPPGEGFGLGFALGNPVTQMLGPEVLRSRWRGRDASASRTLNTASPLVIRLQQHAVGQF